MIATSYRYFLFCLVLFSLPVEIIRAQSVDRSVYSTSGRSVSNADLSVSYTIGESVVFTGSSSSAVLSQGFEQPEPAVITSSTSAVAFMDINAYPNPVTDLLYVHVNSSAPVTDLDVEVTDVFGKKISTQHVAGFSNSTFSLSLSYYPAGVYFIRVFSAAHRLNNTFKIIKA